MTVITVECLYDPRYAGRYEPFFDINDRLADLSMRVVLSQPDTRGDIRIVQSHLVADLRQKNDWRVFAPMIVNERADQEIVAEVYRPLLKEPGTLAWLKECTIRDSHLHNGLQVADYHHYALMARDETEYPARLPRTLLDASDIAKIRVPFSVASFSRFERLRSRPSLEPVRRNIDVFLWGTIKSTQSLYQTHRSQACHAVARLATNNPNYKTLMSVGRLLDDHEAHALMSRSKIVVSQYGHAMSSYRDWEALYAGCVLIKPDSHQQVNYLPDLFKDNLWYVPCAIDFSDLEEKVDMVMQDYPRYFERAQVARAGLMESTNLERRASDFYRMICDVLKVAPSAAAPPFEPIDPATYQAPPENGASVSEKTAPGVRRIAGRNYLTGAEPTFVRSLRGPDATGGPAGVQGWKLVEDTGPGTHDFRHSIEKDASPEDFVVSFMVRPDERSQIEVWLTSGRNQGERAQVSFDLSIGVARSSLTHGPDWRNLDSGIVRMDDGWWWCWLAARTNDDHNVVAFVALAAGDGDIGYTGDGKSGAWFANLRLESGQYPALSFPVEVGTAPRAPDSPVKRSDTGSLVSRELGDYYDRYFNQSGQRRILGFHGDYYLMRSIFALLGQADSFVETGSLSGDSIATVARNFPEMPCYSCELKESNFKSAVGNTRHLPNAHVFKEPSPEFLTYQYGRTPELKGQRVVYWLDAHGDGMELPLPREVEIISNTNEEFCIVIDDFRVPERPYFQFDSYPPVKLEWDLIKGRLNPRRKYKLVYPKYEAHTSLHAPRVGWALIASGSWNLVPKGLDDLFEILDVGASGATA